MNEFQPVTLIEVLSDFYNNKIKILLTIFVVTVVSIIGSLLIPNEYKSSANLLPNPKRGIGFDLFSENGGVANIASSLLGGHSEEANRFYILLESRTTMEKLVDAFDLISVYETESSYAPKLDAISKLRGNINIEALEEGNFKIEVWDKSPERAQRINEYLIQLLNNRNIEISTTEAKNYRLFLAERYSISKEKLDSLSNELTSFQSKNGIIELPSQIESYLSVISDLSSDKYRQEIELELLKQSINPNNPKVELINNKLKLLNQSLTGIYLDNDTTNFLLNYSQLPKQSKTYFDLITQIEIETEILKFLVPLYEQAKMDEAKALPVVSIVDPPSYPELKDKPRRSIIVLSSFLFIIMLTFFYRLLILILKKNWNLLISIIKIE